MALKNYYMLNGLTSMIHKKIHQIFRDVGGRWKKYQWKILVKNLNSDQTNYKKATPRIWWNRLYTGAAESV